MTDNNIFGEDLEFKTQALYQQCFKIIQEKKIISEKELMAMLIRKTGKNPWLAQIVIDSLPICLSENIIREPITKIVDWRYTYMEDKK